MVAEKKRGGNSSPAIFMRMTAALSGVALAVVAVTSVYDPIPVHADAGGLAGAVDYITALEGAEATALTSGGGAAVSSAVMMVYLCTKNPLPAGGYYDADSLTVIEGLYKYNQETHLGYEWFAANSSASSDAPLVFATAKDFEISVTAPFKNYNPVVSYNNYFSIGADLTTYSLCQITNAKGNGLFTSGTYTPSGTNPNYYIYFGGSLSTGGSVRDWDRFPNTDLSTIFTTDPVNASNVIWIRYRATPPSGQIDPANPDVYVENVLRPWVVENYPEYIYLLPEPPQPESQYATDDIVPGIPKDWTIINPELPTSPHLDLTIPEGDFQAIDPGDTFTGFASGVGFWWAMVNTILNTFQIKTLALALLAVAVAIFAMYKIGG